MLAFPGGKTLGDAQHVTLRFDDSFMKLAADGKFAKWTYLVSKYTLDSVLKSRADLMVEKKEEPKPDALKLPAPPAAK